MPKSCLFPYGYTFEQLERVKVFPAAEVCFRTKEGEWAATFVLIDSGAAISALPKSDAAHRGQLFPINRGRTMLSDTAMKEKSTSDKNR